MVGREQFHAELEKMKTMVIDLAEGAKEQLSRSVEALYNGDLEATNNILEDDKVLDQKEMDINEAVILLIAREQPVASDLRRLIIALKISTDLERMADHAKNIAKSIQHLGENHGINIHEKLSDMKEIAIRMIDLSIKSYKHEDMTIARKLAELDDQLDKLYGEVTKELLEETATNPQSIQHIMQMAYCARYIERFGDHATNIGENVLYLIKGKSIDLNA
ncbi:phosphate signaling complex protein PhoU [Aquibacillus sediminis]|uniref:phosphate signaling complex protein PhoU n=1 Tax=Aquibacillus sediminis TaxID=2574734 RepID=UPI0011084099|nr:phosphate signaling complex protein PhoU [Aquibacillus sediminis]